MEECGHYKASATTANILDLQVDELLDETRQPSSNRKFSRIRVFVQKLNEEFLAVLYSTEQRHKAEVTKLGNSLFEAEQRHEEEVHQHKAEVKQLRDALVAAEKHHDDTLSIVEQRHKEEVKELRESIDNSLFEAEQRHEEEVEQLRDSLFAAEQCHKEEVKQLREMMDNELFAAQQRHKEEVTRLREHLDIQTEAVSVLQQRIGSLQKKEQEHVELIKQASDKIRKLEALEESHKNYVKLAGAKISDLTNEERKKEQIANEKISMMEAREEKVVALAKKAALKIKELEARNKVQTAHVEHAASSIEKLKQMVLAKHDDLEAVKENAVRQFDALAEALVEASNQRVLLQASLTETRDQYLEEHEMRKADQKKIASLRKMIEQYDGDGESTWPDLSHALSEDTYATPLAIYRDGNVKTKADFEKLRIRVYDAIPDSIKQNYHEVGFFRINGYYFPVLALGPFDVPPGPLRKQWLENATTSIGVYYYGQVNAALAYDMIPGESFIPYEDGVSQGFHITPTSINEKELSGHDLSPIEQIFKDGIRLIIKEAKSDPGARNHVLKEFKEAFELEGVNLEAVIDSNSFRARFKENIYSSIKSVVPIINREELVAELEKFQLQGAAHGTTFRTTKADKGESRSLRINTESEASGGNDDAASCADSVATPASKWDVDSCATMTSLEDQMYNFMRELASTSKRLPRNALPKKEPRRCDEVTEGRAQLDDDDIRDDAEQNERIPSFQQRLKMFSGLQSKVNTINNKNTVASDTPGNTKSVMQMWQQKAASTNSGCNTPKQTNKNEFATSTSDSDEGTAAKDANTRSVLMPKNLLKKIEAGEELSDHEREILRGIQKLNQINPTSSEDLAVRDSSNEKASIKTAGEIDGEAAGEMVSVE